MRTDVKIGIAVGLFVLVAVIVWVWLGNNTGHDSNSAISTATPAPTPTPRRTPRSLPTPEPTPAPTAVPTVTLATPAPGSTPVVQLMEPNIPTPPPTEPTHAPSRMVGGVSSLQPPTGGIEDERLAHGGAATSGHTDTAREGTYVVQAGDSRGLYGIAEKYYGNGKYFYLIKDANPAVNANQLQAGQILKMPALPTTEVARPPGGAVEPAGVLSGTQKTYTVQSGDSGFWGIAAKPQVYGDGKYWYLIKKANPDVESSKLKIGQTLVIPPKPVPGAAPAPTTPNTSRPAADGAAVSHNGQKTYKVQSGDNFWSIAQKEYGDGKYHDLIAKANPTADSSRLKIGQELVIPPKPSEAASVSTRPAATTRPAASRTSTRPAATRERAPEVHIDTGRPDFGE